jgi:hypothetical protein
MKFPQLAIGQRFELDGIVYVKVGPMTARAEQSGRQRMIARFAEVTPFGAPAASPQAARADTLAPTAVRTAMETYHAACRRALSAATPQAAEQAIDAARSEFLKTLGME